MNKEIALIRCIEQVQGFTTSIISNNYDGRVKNVAWRQFCGLCITCCIPISSGSDHIIWRQITRVLAHILSIRHALLNLVSGGDSPIYIFATNGSRTCQRSKHFIYFLFIFCWHTLKMPKILSHKQKNKQNKTNKQTNDKDRQTAKNGSI